MTVLSNADRQITHGFPVDPDPLFKSNAFPIENRPGLHDQSLESVISQISNIVNSSDATVGDVTSWPPRIKEEVGKWLSDWHLVSFLCYQGLFTLVRFSFFINVSYLLLDLLHHLTFFLS